MIRTVPSNAQSVLNQLVKAEFANMSVFAKACGVNQSLVWRDCQGRQISDKRFAAYISVVSEDGRERLIRARLQDVLPKEFQTLVQVGSPTRVNEAVSSIALLSKDSLSALDKLAAEMVADPEFHRWVMAFIQRVC